MRKSITEQKIGLSSSSSGWTDKNSLINTKSAQYLWSPSFLCYLMGDKSSTSRLIPHRHTHRGFCTWKQVYNHRCFTFVPFLPVSALMSGFRRQWWDFILPYFFLSLTAEDFESRCLPWVASALGISVKNFSSL